MRDATLALDARGGDAVSEAYLAASLHRRVLALADDPDDPAVLRPAGPRASRRGRSASTSGAGTSRRRGRADGPRLAGADVSRVLPGHRADPQGVAMRRRFGFERGELTASRTSTCRPRRGAGTRSAILTAEIERPRVGPMRDIVATIQPEQDEIVRADLGRDHLRAGRAGHRQDRGRPAPRGVPALHAPRAAAPRRRARRRAEPRVPLLHLRRAAGARRGRGPAGHGRGPGRPRVPVRGEDRAEVAALKDDARMAAGAATARCTPGSAAPTEPLVVPRGSCRWRVRRDELRRIVDELRAPRRALRRGRAMLPQRLAARGAAPRWRRPATRPDDRVQDAVARSRAGAQGRRPRCGRPSTRSGWCCRCWPTRPRWPRAADGVLDADASRRCWLWRRPPRARAAARWTPADAVLVDEAAGLVDREPSLGHVVVDEAQDLSPMQCAPSPGAARPARDRARRPRPGHRAVGRRRLGRHARATWASRPRTRGAAPRLPGAGRRARLRQPAAAARARRRARRVGAREPTARSTWSRPSTCCRRGRGYAGARPSRARSGSSSPTPTSTRLHALAPGRSSTPCSAPTTSSRGRGSRSCRPRWPRAWSTTTSSSSSRPTIVAAEPREGLRRLYVVLTRAVSGLSVVHAGRCPASWPGGRGVRASRRGVAGTRRPGRRPRTTSPARAPTCCAAGPSRTATITTSPTSTRSCAESTCWQSEADRPDTVRLAAWFHDAVYDPTARRTTRSAAPSWRTTSLRRFGVDADLVARSCRLVRLTATHDPGGDDRDGAVLCDADLAVLAVPQHVRVVRRGSPPRVRPPRRRDLRRGRAAVLRSLLDRPALFRTARPARRGRTRRARTCLPSSPRSRAVMTGAGTRTRLAASPSGGAARRVPTEAHRLEALAHPERVGRERDLSGTVLVTRGGEPVFEGSDGYADRSTQTPNAGHPVRAGLRDQDVHRRRRGRPGRGGSPDLRRPVVWCCLRPGGPRPCSTR